MKPLLTCLAFLCIIGSGLAEVPKDRKLAVVDGVAITDSVLQGMLALQEPMLREKFLVEPQKLAKEMAELKRTILDELIDQQVLVNEFTSLRGVIKAPYVDEAIADFLKVNWKNDRLAFVDDLARRGVSLRQFRESQERLIITRVMCERLVPEIQVTEEQVSEYYANYKSYWGEKPFEKVKGEVTSALKAELYRKAVGKVIKNLRDKAGIQKMASR